MKWNSEYIIKCAIAFVLTLVPVLVLADTTTSSTVSGLMMDLQSMTFTPPVGDMSISFLSKMFGAVPGVAQLKGTSILGVLFAVFNAGILGISGVFISYSITKIVTDTTMDGAAMGKSTTVWTAVRCALSTSLLVPQASGYSMINGIIMWVVVQSVGLADVTWSKAMDYLKGGGSIYSTTSSPSAVIDYSLINYTEDSGNSNIDGTKSKINVGSADVLRSLVCSHTVYNALLKNQQAENQRLTDKKNTGVVLTAAEQAQLNNTTMSFGDNSSVFNVYHDFGNSGSSAPYVVQFPYIPKENSNPLASYGLSNSVPTTLTGLCGTISYDVPPQAPGESSVDYATRVKTYVPVKYQGLQSMISTLDPVAKQLVAKAAVDSSTNTTKLDIKANPLYTDAAGQQVYLLRNIKDVPLNYLPDNQTINELVRTAAQDITKVPSINNWPFGVNEILGAAAEYQITLAPAQNIGQVAALATVNTIYDQAKAVGWIGAGGYYRVLAKVQASAALNYQNYRLTGYEDTTKILDAKTGREYVYQTLFKKASTGPSGRTPVALIDRSSADTLGNALKWIYLVTPYAKLYGLVSSPGLANIKGDSGLATYNFSSLGGINGLSEAAIDTMFAFGCVMIVAPFVGAAVSPGGGIAGAVLGMALEPVAIPLLMGLPTNWLELDVSTIFNDWNTYMNNSPTMDPILKLENVGRSMMINSIKYIDQIKAFFIGISITFAVSEMGTQLVGAAYSLTTLLGVGMGAEEVVGQLIDVQKDIQNMIKSIIYINLPMGFAVVGPMFVNGAVLGIYLPLIPYLLFLFGVISWFISVLVIMAAAPLICFMMLWGNSSQENPILAKEAEQFITQIIAAFFRPTLMIMGLIAGMLLSYIGVDVLNMGFSQVANSTVLSFGDSGSMQMIGCVGMMTIYTFTMVSVVNMCFSTIYLLYSEVIRFLGVQASATGLEAPQLESIKAGATEFATAGASGMKETAAGMKDMGYKGTAKLKAPSKGGESGAKGGGTPKPPAG